tara:strand:+ start:6857 stop:8425 length:1569 start_codon:yes stop_codon:yes gene_type:complete
LKFRKLFFSLIFLLLLINPTYSSNSKPIRINISNEPPTLDWNLATDSTSFQIINNIMHGLTKIDDDNEIVPNLAKSWTIDESGKIITIKIREVFWTDGKRLDAKDFLDSWERLLNPVTAADYAYFLYDIKNAKDYNLGKISDFKKVGVKALDKETLEITLTDKKSYFVSLLSFMSTFPIRKDIIEKYNNKWIEPENIVTLGNYILSKWENHDFILLKPRDSSKNDIMLIMNSNPTSSLAMFENGKLDIVDGSGIPLLEIPYLKKKKLLKSKNRFANTYIGFNLDEPPFDNEEIRKAFAISIDKRIFEKVFQGTVKATNYWLPERIPPMTKDSANTESYSFDEKNISLANRIIDKNGYRDRSDFPRVKLLYPESGNNRIIAEILQNRWSENLGIMIDIEGLEWKIYLSTLDNDRPNMFRGGWIADYPHAHNFMNLFTCNSGNNETGWCNKDYDNKIFSASSNYNSKKSEELYNEASAILTVNDIAIIPLFYSVQLYLKSERIKNAGFTSMGVMDFDRIIIKKD